MYFNILMVTVSTPKYEQYGYLWGPNTSLHPTSWLQFADDTALIAHSTEGAQALLNVCIVWCKWSDMTIRIDKCTTFGMTKRSGQSIQFEPCLCVVGVAVPPVTMGGCFVYLGKKLNFAMDDRLVKGYIETKLQDLLTTTYNLPVRPQSKLKIQ